MAGIEEELDRVERNVADALAATAEMGASVPETANSDNLGTLIRSIPKGGGASVLGDDGKIKKEHLPAGYPYMTRQEGYVLEECQPFYDEESGAFVGTTSFSVLENGLNCTVNVNGTDYECVMTELPEEGVYVLGNLGVVTEDESLMTDDPFIVIAYPPEIVAAQGFDFAVVMLDGSTSLRLSIKADVPTYEKLSNDYLDLDWIPKSTSAADLGGDVIWFSIRKGEQFAFANVNDDLIYKLMRSGSIEANTTTVNGADERHFISKRKDAVDGFWFGNFSIVNPSFSNTGEPFVIGVATSSDSYGFACSIALAAPAEENTTIAVFPMPTLNPMPANMLPICDGLFLDIGNNAYISIRYREYSADSPVLAVYNSRNGKKYEIPLIAWE